LTRTVKQSFLGKKDAFRPLLEPKLGLVVPFYTANTALTSITKMSKFTFNSKDKWLVLPTLCATQSPTVKIKAQNSALSEQKPHHQAGKNDGDTAKRIQKHQHNSLSAADARLFSKR
jgi:hypothetical protein